MPGTIFCSLLVVGSWSTLIYSGSIETIWPMFGVANQILSAIALGVGTTMLIKSGKGKYAFITGIPMIFMFCTTFTASYQLCIRFLNAAKIKVDQAFTLYLDAALVGFVSILTILILFDMIRCWIGIYKESGSLDIDISLPLETPPEAFGK